MLGAVVTQAVLTEDGQHLVTVESGHLVIWNVTSRQQITKGRFNYICKLMDWSIYWVHGVHRESIQLVGN